MIEKPKEERRHGCEQGELGLKIALAQKEMNERRVAGVDFLDYVRTSIALGFSENESWERAYKKHYNSSINPLKIEDDEDGEAMALYEGLRTAWDRNYEGSDAWRFAFKQVHGTAPII